MASEIIRGALLSLPSRRELVIASPRTAAVKRCAREVTDAIAREQNKQTLGSFSQELLSSLRSPLELKQGATMPQRREKMWVHYVELRGTTLRRLWKAFLGKIQCSHVTNEPLFMELMNESIFESLIKGMFDTGEPGEQAEQHTEHLELTKDECNILRYACGYVAMKLQLKFLKQPGNKAAVFVECLDHMEVEGSTSSLLSYTREWVDKINRGGLFDVSDEAYYLFVAIELSMRKKLMNHLKRSITLPESVEGKSAIVEFVTGDSDVQFHWLILSVDIEDEQDSDELLKRIVELWLNIRGFSISKGWMEDYKAIVCETTKRKKSLRKGLKRSELAD